MTKDYKEKFPIGSKWNTRGGEVVEVIYHNDKCKEYPIVVVFNNGEVDIYKEDGSLLNNEVCDFDITTPYKEPLKGEFWANVYKNGENIIVYNDRDTADFCADTMRIACVRVEWTEGEGLDAMTIFAATDINGRAVKFQAWSWEAAEAIARRNGYRNLGVLIREVAA